MGKKYNKVDEYALDVEGKTFSELNDREKANTESAFAGYLQKNNLQETYDSAIKELDSNLQSNQRTAYFNNEKIMKYLPNNLKVQGLQNNVGAQNQAYIDANNSYQTNLNAITQDYNKNKTTMLNDYNTNALAIDESVRQEQKANNAKFDQIEREDSLMQEEIDRENDISLTDSQRVNLDTYYQSLIGDDGKISSADYQNLAKYAEELSANLSDSGKSHMTSMLDGYKKAVRSEGEQKEIDASQTLNKYKTGVGLNDGVKVASDAGGGFVLAPGEKVKIIDGDEGLSVDEFYRRASISGSGGLNGGEAGFMGSEKTDSIAIASSAKAGRISNGTIVDTNKGSGQKLWIYLNGKFYRIEKA
jgi:hypothetical protein